MSKIKDRKLIYICEIHLWSVDFFFCFMKNYIINLVLLMIIVLKLNISKKYMKNDSTILSKAKESEKKNSNNCCADRETRGLVRR